MKHFLITYISPNGSTAEVAHYIEKQLDALGARVTCQTLDQVKDLAPYDAVVVAAPINGMQWRPEALHFIEKHRADLSSKSVSYCALAMMAEQGRPMWRRAVQKAFNRASAIVAPTATAIFGGVAGQKMPGLMQWVFGLPKNLAPDQRNWSSIEGFARKIYSLATMD